MMEQNQLDTNRASHKTETATMGRKTMRRLSLISGTMMKLAALTVPATLLMPAGLEAKGTGASFLGLPSWLQALIVAAVVLVAYALLAAFFSAHGRSKDEQIIHRKEGHSPETSGQRPPYVPPRQKTPRTQSPFPFPIPQPQREPDDQYGQKPKPAKKSNTWGTIIFVIIIINILRQCLSNN